MRKAVAGYLAALAAFALIACGDAQPSAPRAGDGGWEGGEEPRALLQESREAADENRLADARALLDQALALEPENPALWVAIARLRYRGGEHQQAITAAQRAVELGPGHAPALLLRAQLVRDAYGLSDALVWFEAAVEADPNNPEALGEYAATLGDAGYYTEMLAVTRALADIAPADPRVFYLQAVLAARAGQPVLAKSLLERSGLAQSGVPAAMMLNALIDIEGRNYDSAAAQLDALVQKQPGNVRVHELLARALWLGQRDGELVARFGKAARRQSTSPYLAMLVGRALERQGKRAEAAPFLERAYAGRDAPSAPLPMREGLPGPTVQLRTLIEAGRLSEAGRAGQRLRTRFKGSGDIAALAGDTAMVAGDYSEALELYRDAARVRRSWPLALKMAATMRKLGEGDAADALLARHLIGEPRNTEVLLLAGERAARDENWPRVAILLDNAIELGAGNDPKLLALRGRAARALGEADKARRFEQMAHELHPAHLPQT
ncbi:MAG: tetratricopeptide repeat protein [Pseudomonadota bacterium]